MGPSEQLKNLQRTFTYSFLGKPVPTTWEVFTGFPFRESVKKTFFWEISPKCGWVVWLIPKQGPNLSKPPQITPKIALVDPNFTFCSPKSHKNPGVGKQIWERSPKKKTFFLRLPLGILYPTILIQGRGPKKIRKNCALLTNQGGRGSKKEKKANFYFDKVFFQ